MTQAKVTASQFSFKLAAVGSELYLGGLNSALFVAGSTIWYPVTSQSYWVIPGTANVAGQPVTAVGTFSAIIDTGTSVVVVRPFASTSLVVVLIFLFVQAPTVDAANFWAAVPNSAVYGSGYYTFECVLPCLLRTSQSLTFPSLQLRLSSQHLPLVRHEQSEVGHPEWKPQPRSRRHRLDSLRRRHRRRRHWSRRLDRRRIVRLSLSSISSLLTKSTLVDSSRTSTRLSTLLATPSPSPGSHKPTSLLPSLFVSPPVYSHYRQHLPAIAQIPCLPSKPLCSIKMSKVPNPSSKRP